MLFLRSAMARNFLESVEQASQHGHAQKGEDRHESQDAGLTPHGVGSPRLDGTSFDFYIVLSLKGTSV